jgi:hypothetical protein
MNKKRCAAFFYAFFVCILDFSLTGFMADNSVTDTSQITGLMLEKLKETLGLSNHMNSAPCSLSDSKYTPNTNGIKNGKKHYTYD